MEDFLLSIVSPVYNAEKIVPLLVSKISSNAKKITPHFEIILVEDGSKDESWKAIAEEAEKNKHVKGVKLSRNFGQHYAITAGLNIAKGDWVIVMDCDLQDKPSEFEHLYQKTREGFDIVLARREIRNDTYFKKIFSKLFYHTLGYLTGTKQDPAIANFGIYNKKVIENINKMKEPIRYFPTMVRWVGFNRTTLNVEHGKREIGKTSYNMKKLFRLAMDIILANSDKPIRLTIKLGFSVALFSFIFGIITLIKYFKGEIIVLGYTSLLISIWFLSGLILFVLGIIGLYLGKTFEGVKNRPIYIIDEAINLNE